MQWTEPQKLARLEVVKRRVALSRRSIRNFVLLKKRKGTTLWTPQPALSVTYLVHLRSFGARSDSASNWCFSWLSLDNCCARRLVLAGSSYPSGMHPALQSERDMGFLKFHSKVTILLFEDATWCLWNDLCRRIFGMSLRCRFNSMSLWVCHS